jgi:hypothetical protein
VGGSRGACVPAPVRDGGYVCRPVIDTATVFDWLYRAGRWTWHDPDGYNFVSGPLADVTLIRGAYAIIRRHNCHAKGCWRIGRHKVPGTDYIVCRRHHPHVTPTAEDILAAHKAAVERGLAVSHVAQAVVDGTERAVHGAETAAHEAETAVRDAEQVLRRDSPEGPPTDSGGRET